MTKQPTTPTTTKVINSKGELKISTAKSAIALNYYTDSRGNIRVNYKAQEFALITPTEIKTNTFIINSDINVILVNLQKTIKGDTKVSETTPTKKANKMKKATTTTKVITPIKEQIKSMKQIKKNVTKATKATVEQIITISSDFKKEVTKLVSSDNKTLEYTDKRENNSLSMINKSVAEIIILKKQVDVPTTVTNIKEYKTRIIKKALLELNDNHYYKSVVEIAIHYINSNYTVDFNGDKSISLATLKRVLDEKPTKASIKGKNNEQIRTILDTNKATAKTKKQTDLKASLSPKAKKLFSDLSTDDIATIKAYFNA